MEYWAVLSTVEIKAPNVTYKLHRAWRKFSLNSVVEHTDFKSKKLIEKSVEVFRKA